MKQRSHRAFTILELMIVVTIVGILSLLGMAAIGRIKEKAVRTVIANNLRQLYNAKEYYYSATGDNKITAVPALVRLGYLNASTRDQVMGLNNLTSHSGWHYYPALWAGASVFAYQGVRPSNSMPTGEVIWYPNPPEDPANYFSSGTGGGAPARGATPSGSVAGAGGNVAAQQPAAQPTNPVQPPAPTPMSDLPRRGRNYSSNELLGLVKSLDPSLSGSLQITGVTADQPAAISISSMGGGNFRIWPTLAGTNAPLQDYHLKVQINDDSGSTRTVEIPFRVAGH